MANRLVVLSDLWGSKKGLWITSYLGYLQQYFEIVYHDVRELSDMDPMLFEPRDMINDFFEGGLEKAVTRLMAKESIPSHYLTFCAGGTIAWQAALQGLPMESLYAVSPLNLHQMESKPDCPVTLVYGEYHDNRPTRNWSENLGVTLEAIPRFGNELYSDEKIIRKVSMDLLEAVLKKKHKGFTKPLSVF